MSIFHILRHLKYTRFLHMIRDAVYQNHLNQQSEKGESKMDVDDDRHVMVDLWLSPLA